MAAEERPERRREGGLSAGRGGRGAHDYEGGRMDYVVVARLCASALVHAECDAPVWKQANPNPDLGGGGGGGGGRRRSAGGVRVGTFQGSVFRTTPAELFVQRNAFLDEADGLTERVLFPKRRRARSRHAMGETQKKSEGEEGGGGGAAARQKEERQKEERQKEERQKEEEAEERQQPPPREEKSVEGTQTRPRRYEEAARREDLWEQIDFLYSMLAHAVENMSPEDCQEWLRISAEVDFCSDGGDHDDGGEEEGSDDGSNLGYDEHGGENMTSEDLDNGSQQLRDERRRKRRKKKKKKEKKEKKKTKKKKEKKKTKKMKKKRIESQKRQRHPLHNLLQQLVSVASCSDDRNERGAAMSVLEALFDNGFALDVDATLCDLLCSETLCLALCTHAAEGGDDHGHTPTGAGSDHGMVVVAELLELVLKIVATFPSPLAPQHRKLLRRVVLPLHVSAGLPCFLNEIIPIVLHLLQKAEHGRPGAILDYLRRMARAWPRCSPRAERAFLSEMLDVLTHVHGSMGAMGAMRDRSSGGGGGGGSGGRGRGRGRFELMAGQHGDDGLDPRTGGGGVRALKMLEAAAEEVFVGIARGLRSPHFEVAMHATSAFTECDAVRLILFSGGGHINGRAGGTDGMMISMDSCAARCLEAVMPSLLDGAEYWHAGVQSRCREVVCALQRGARRGWLDRGLIEGMVRMHYGDGDGGRWLEEDYDEDRGGGRQDTYDTYSSGDEMYGEGRGGLSPSRIQISQAFDDDDDDDDDDEEDVGEVSESKYVSPRAEEDLQEERRQKESAASKTPAPEGVSVSGEQEPDADAGGLHRHSDDNRYSDEWRRDTGDTEDTDYTEDSDYYDTRSNRSNRSNRSSRSVRSVKSSRSSASSPPPVTPPRIEHQGGSGGGGGGLLAAAAKAAASNTKAQRHGIRGRRGGENVDMRNRRARPPLEGGQKGGDEEDGEDWAVMAATRRDKPLFDVTPPLSPSFIDMRKLDALHSPSPTGGYGGAARRRGRRGVAADRHHSRRRARRAPPKGHGGGRGSALRRAVLNQHQSLRGGGTGSMLFAGMGSESGNGDGGRRSVVVRGGPASPKFVVHDGRKKRLAWGGAVARGRENNDNSRRHQRRQRRAPPVISSSSSGSSSSDDGEEESGAAGGGEMLQAGRLRK